MPSNKPDIAKDFKAEDVTTVANTNVEIKDQEMYEKWLEVTEWLNNNKTYTTSTGITYNLAMRQDLFEKKTNELDIPKPEKVKMLKLRKEYMLNMMSKGNLMKRAFRGNTKLNGDGEVVIKSEFDKRREEILELFGRMFTTSEVHEVCITKYKLNVNKQQVQGFRIANSSEIQKRTEVFKSQYTDMRLAIKRGRLEELVWMYSKRKRMYEISGKADDHRLLLQTLEQIRKEAEGEQISINGNIQVEHLLDHHLKQEQITNLQIKEIVLGRIAAKSNVPPVMFLAQLNNSWYSKVFEGDVIDVEHEDITSPTSSTYDFEKIQKVNEQSQVNKQIEIAKIQQQIKSETTSQGVDLKALLLAKLNSQKGDVLYAKNSLTFKASE